MGLIIVTKDGQFVPCREDPYDDSRLIPAKYHQGRSKNDNKNDKNDNTGSGSGGSGTGAQQQGAQQRDTQESVGFDPSDAAQGPMQVSWHDLDNINEDQIKADAQKVNAGGPATTKEIGHAAAVSAIKSSVDPNAPRADGMAVAMRNAAALFDQKHAKGEVTGGGDRQAAINAAVTVITGLLLKYEEADDDVANIAHKFM